MKLNKGDAFIVIKLKTKGNFKQGDVIRFSIENNPLCEFADEDANTIDNVLVKTYSIEHKNSLNIENSENNSNSFNVYPNPAKDILNINYNISNDGIVNIELYNVLGDKVLNLITNQLKGSHFSNVNISSLSSGIYTCKMKFNDDIIVKRFIISK